jgi:hypothetical protein
VKNFCLFVEFNHIKFLKNYLGNFLQNFVNSILQKPLISPFGSPQPLASCAERLLSFAKQTRKVAALRGSNRCCNSYSIPLNLKSIEKKCKDCCKKIEKRGEDPRARSLKLHVIVVLVLDTRILYDNLFHVRQ